MHCNYYFSQRKDLVSVMLKKKIKTLGKAIQICQAQLRPTTTTTTTTTTTNLREKNQF